jgi:hypothetical protein
LVLIGPAGCYGTKLALFLLLEMGVSIIQYIALQWLFRFKAESRITPLGIRSVYVRRDSSSVFHGLDVPVVSLTPYHKNDIKELERICFP